jgi:dipeptidyl aminopeptidase/acylaminoacyl peptidase
MKMLAGLLVVALGAASGQAKRPMTFADLMAMKRVSDPQISPSGRWVLFSVTEVSLEANTKTNHLWVVGIDGKTPERQVTSGDGESNGRFSPDGKMISLTMKDQIFEMPWDEATGMLGAPVQVTDVNGGADGAIWSPDSKRLLFVVNVYPECSDVGDWSREDDCDKTKQEAADKSPVKAQLWTHLLYRHWNAFTGERRSHIAVVSARDGSGLRDLTPRKAVGDAETPTFSLGGPLGYAWAPDSKEIAYVTNLDPVPAASTNNDVFTLKLDQRGAMPVKVSTSLGSDDGPQYSPDGKWLALRSQKRAGYESDRFRLMLFDRAKKTEPELLPKFDDWVDELTRSASSRFVEFTSARRGEERIYSASVDGELTLIAGQGEYSDIHGFEPPRTSTLLDFRPSMIAVRMSVSAPSAVVAITFHDMKTQTPDDWEFKTVKTGAHTRQTSSTNSHYQQIAEDTVLPHVNGEKLSNVNLLPLERFSFSGALGAKVEGFIVKPPNFDPAKKYPIKFLIHGGPQGAWGDAWSYRWNPELMAASGYVVVMVNPRGSTGYGQKFIDGVNGDWGGKAYIDLMKGLDAAEAKFSFIDKSRECALGASYGGYMYNWILTHTNRFKCIVIHDGMYNPASAYGDTEELWFNEWEFRRTGDKEPGQPWRYAGLPADEDPFRKWSPMLHIQNAKTPTLIITRRRTTGWM